MEVVEVKEEHHQLEPVRYPKRWLQYALGYILIAEIFIGVVTTSIILAQEPNMILLGGSLVVWAIVMMVTLAGLSWLLENQEEKPTT